MRQMKDSGVKWIGEVPEGWTISLLSTFFCERKEKNISNKETNLLSLSYGSVINKDINTKEGLLPESFEGYNIIQPNDIVFRLTDLQNDKRSLRSAINHQVGIITSAYTTIFQRADVLDNTFYHFFFRALDECKVLYGIGSGVRQSMNYKDLAKLKLCVPPLPEQQAIASYLDKKCGEIDSLVGLQEEMIAELKAYKQSVITEAVTKGLDPDAKMKDSGVEWIGEVPEGWVSAKSKYFITSNDSGVWGEEPKGDSLDKIVIRSTEQTIDGKWDIIDPAIRNIGSLNAISSIKSGDLLITKSSGSQLHIGKTTIANDWFNNKEVYFSNFIQRIRVHDCLPIFIWYLMNSILVREQFVYRQNATSGLGNINACDINNIFFPIPPLPEQHRIATYLDTKTSEIDQLITIKQQKITELKEYKKSLIYECVTGKKEILQTTN